MKHFLTVIFFIVISNFIQAQTTTPPPPPVVSDHQTTSHKRYWIEFKNGRFKSDYNTIADGTERLVLETLLYDTGKGGPPPTIIALNDGSNLSYDNSQHILPLGKYIHIQPSVADVVAGDMMVLAVTYNASLPDSALQGVDITYSVVVLYNEANGTPFFNQTQAGNFNGTTLPAIRCPNNETIETGLVTDLINAGAVNSNDASGYKYYVALKGINPTSFEKNVFISVLPSKDLTEGTLTSVRALLIKKTRSNNGRETNALKDSSQLNGMQVALAHDPNYLRASPTCITSTKRGGHKINYTLHFQNTGAGAADTVIVTINMPKGMDLNSFNNSNISKAVYGGMDFKTDLDLINIDKKNDKIVFKFNPYKRRLTGMIFLSGTEECVNAFADKRTMGDIVFTVTTTDKADSLLNTFASIEFHSKAYSGKDRKSKYESPVETNAATVRIKECCDCTKCNNCIPPGCYKIAGLCWWWWIVILLAIIGIYIILRKRKKQANYNV
jgi:hypothetical protein